MATLWDTFACVWNMEVDDSTFAIYAQDAGLPSSGVLYDILQGKRDPVFPEAVKMLKWINERLLPNLGVKHRYCLGDLWPHLWPRPTLRDEVMMILGIASRRGKKMDKEEVVTLVGDEAAKAICGKHKEVEVEDVFNYLKDNKDVEVLVKEGAQILK